MAKSILAALSVARNDSISIIHAFARVLEYLSNKSNNCEIIGNYLSYRKYLRLYRIYYGSTLVLAELGFLSSAGLAIAKICYGKNIRKLRARRKTLLDC